MTDKNADTPRRDEDKDADNLKDLRSQPIDEKDAERVKGGQALRYDDESPKE